MKLSPSQINLWNTCPYRWGRVYLDGDRETGAISASNGEIVHQLLEKYLRDGEVPARTDRLGKLAFAMCANLPPKGTVPNVEQEFEFTHDGIVYGGRVDARTPTQIYDHKTTSNISRYGKTAGVLETDIQALIYARWMDCDGELVWNYGQTKGDEDNPKVKKVVLPVLRDEVRRKFDEHVVPIAKQIAAAYDSNDTQALERNYKSCELYPPHGCPRKRECNVVTPLAQKLADRFAKAPVNKPIQTLYVDCLPLQGPVTHAGPLISAAAATAAKDLDLPYIMLMDFGKGPGALAAQLKDDIERSGIYYEQLVLFTKNPEGRAVQQVLASLAVNVVQGI